MEQKILQTILGLYKNMESDWRPRLEAINIWENVYELYYEVSPEEEKEVPRFKGNIRTSNTILAYIVLAYHNQSEWLNMNEDRTDNKNRIMNSLAGISYQTNTAFCEAIIGVNDPYSGIIEWMINSQMDWRWKQILTDIEYHSMAQNIARFAYGTKDMAEAGRMLSLAEVRMRSANELKEELRNENVKLDTALNKEKRIKLTDRENGNFMLWEGFIRRRDIALSEELSVGKKGNGTEEYDEVNV